MGLINDDARVEIVMITALFILAIIMMLAVIVLLPIIELAGLICPAASLHVMAC